MFVLVVMESERPGVMVVGYCVVGDGGGSDRGGGGLAVVDGSGVCRSLKKCSKVQVLLCASATENTHCAVDCKPRASSV